MNALYARQSVDRDDSLSIEGQLERCRFENGSAECREYVDRGFSGKNTNRPAFRRMLQDIRAGQIDRVIVYRLDRISRSILDFARMMDLFEQHAVQFLSSTERFDTSAPIGRAMLNICIVFAQLERETIQRRVLDAYADRSRRGFYMGGRTPYGFSTTQIEIDGVHTACYTPVEAEAAQMECIFTLYAQPQMTLGALARTLRERRLPHLRGGAWNTTRLSEILQNPIYCRADQEVCAFFRAHGAEILNETTDFIGRNGCYLFRGQSANKRADLAGTRLVIAPHEGLVPAEIWLTCRRKLLQNPRAAARNAKSTWLSGVVKCARCGYALTVTRSKSAAGRYFVCSGKSSRACCSGLSTIHADELEAAIAGVLLLRLRSFQPLPPDLNCNDEVKSFRAQIDDCERALEALTDRALQAAPPLMERLNRRACRIAAQMETLQKQLEEQSSRYAPQHSFSNESWDSLALSARQRLLHAMVERIRVDDTQIDINWRI